MLDPKTLSKEYLSPSQAANAVRTHPHTVVRWILCGIKTRVGRHYLRARKVGGRWRIQPQDLQAFLDNTNADAHTDNARRHESDTRRRARAIQRPRAFGVLPPAGRNNASR